MAYPPEKLGGIARIQKPLTFALVKNLAFLKYRRFQSLFINRRSVRLGAQTRKYVHAALYRRAVDPIPITFHLNLSQNGGDEVFVYWRANNVFEEKVETCFAYLGDVCRFGVDSILMYMSGEDYKIVGCGAPCT